jgi:hypothetical protein
MAEAGGLPAFVPRAGGGGSYYARSHYRPDTILVASSRPLPDTEPVEPVAAPPVVEQVGVAAVASTSGVPALVGFRPLARASAAGDAL